VKIAPLVSELRGLESRPLKKIKKNLKKNIGKIYSPSGKFADRAKKIKKLEMRGKA